MFARLAVRLIYTQVANAIVSTNYERPVNVLNGDKAEGGVAHCAIDTEPKSGVGYTREFRHVKRLSSRLATPPITV